MMLTLKDDRENTYRAVTTAPPKLNSRSKWHTVVKYINNEAITFYFVKGNGSYFYFLYKDTWHRMIKASITNEYIQTKYTIILEDWYFLHNK
jgi:hypothetical protein